ncbi:MAG: UTP--glucose-1-phosphate uridylyltransferase [Candidatus Dormibacteraeota bacterium]|jgi:UTP--glucose-1-phosphate uridylyltransferase|nr:UTP--glucose-1-phosphate uridylyltransferase [Candidatus Dormibacteraeota bacterium]
MTRSTVRKAIITAAGLGTRFLPVTKAQPKEMLPLLDKPTIQYGVEEARDSGIEEVVMVIGGGKRAIVDHFDRSRELEFYLAERDKKDLLDILADVDALTDRVQLVYVQQKEPLGLGHAVGCAHRLVEDEPCALLLPDDVILGAEPALSQLIRAYSETGATVIATRRVPRDQISRYGIIATGASEGRLHEVVDLVEKPDLDDAPSDLAIFGRYVLRPEVLTAISETPPGTGKEIQLTDAIRQTLGKGRVVAWEFEGDYYDTGTVQGYLRSNLALALQRDDLREQMLAVVRELVDASEVGG